ncbi:collagen alpha-1(I) chain-like isoform X1 [Corapipo altera]|uniref:collagen alpha-1(I) chain-like isoform X1 n=1 Tax=Corapipo altera TaxID=415028 RepID=UPI000FD6A89B|nr:collagen alpha-1(I) chain-like isoform X1 [Corapipo altera]
MLGGDRHVPPTPAPPGLGEEGAGGGFSCRLSADPGMPGLHSKLVLPASSCLPGLSRNTGLMGEEEDGDYTSRVAKGEAGSPSCQDPTGAAGRAQQHSRHRWLRFPRGNDRSGVTSSLGPCGFSESLSSTSASALAARPRPVGNALPAGAPDAIPCLRSGTRSQAWVDGLAGVPPVPRPLGRAVRHRLCGICCRIRPRPRPLPRNRQRGDCSQDVPLEHRVPHATGGVQQPLPRVPPEPALPPGRLAGEPALGVHQWLGRLLHQRGQQVVLGHAGEAPRRCRA